MAKCSSKDARYSRFAQLCPGYEKRPQQQKMIDSVDDLLGTSGVLMIEAETGVGKTLGYLLPILSRIDELDKPIVLSTSTIALQEQLFHKDIALAKDICENDQVDIQLVKGKRNYICYSKLNQIKEDQNDFFDSQSDYKKTIIDWVGDSLDGDLTKAPFSLDRSFLNRLACTDFCSRLSCSFDRKCFLGQMRKRIEKADILVTNHHVLLSDLALKGEDYQILPEYGTLVLDEAHALCDATENCFSIYFSHEKILKNSHFLQQIYPYISDVLVSDLKQNSEKLIATSENFFDSYFKNQESSFLLKEPLEDFLYPFLDYILNIKTILENHKQSQKERSQNSHLHIEKLIDSYLNEEKILNIFSSFDFDEYTFWGEKSEGQYVLRATCSNSSELLKNDFFSNINQVLLTSATLATHHGFKYTSGKMGLEQAEFLKIETPFDMEKQMEVWVTDDSKLLPFSKSYLDYLEIYCQKMILQTKGGCFLLFTNMNTMRTLYSRMVDFLESNELTVFSQHIHSKVSILDGFIEKPHCVVFGLDSFWTGIDISGDHLRNVVITKLPFPSPQLPLNKRKIADLERDGKNGFNDFILPEALLKFRQGVGRLIRTRKDKGQVAILDPRICLKSYGKFFFEALHTKKIQKIPHYEPEVF
ncbi:hypothetical protein AB834_05275 [PVC group bacterium (ex Bugula neritina AB1)]|nr:hypothetical protein AB834_05275 [PVC group bacterium (ex Bugula neritina AB1)]